MPPFIYRCPYTGYRVQGWGPDDDKSEGADDVFVDVTCLVCGLVHFVNPKWARRRAKTASRPILPELTDGVWDGGVSHHGLRCLGRRWANSVSRFERTLIVAPYVPSYRRSAHVVPAPATSWCSALPEDAELFASCRRAANGDPENKRATRARCSGRTAGGGPTD